MKTSHETEGSMGAGHDHTSPSLGETHRWRLWATLGLTLLVMVAQLLGSWFTNSLALASDAAHMATDVLGIAMALAAIITVRRARSHPRRTFGLYRLEVLAALGNTVLLFGAATWVAYESVLRLYEPPEVDAWPMLGVAVIGLGANVVAMLLLRHGADQSINVRGAYLEVLGDTLGSIGVIVAAGIIITTGWWHADPVIAVAVALFILPRAVRLGAGALRILLQTAPAGLNPVEVARTLRGIDGVSDVHDLHVWTLTSGMDVASAHLSITPRADLGDVLSEARELLSERFGIDHTTLQLEPRDVSHACGGPAW